MVVGTSNALRPTSMPAEIQPRLVRTIDVRCLSLRLLVGLTRHAGLDHVVAGRQLDQNPGPLGFGGQGRFAARILDVHLHPREILATVLHREEYA
jgi:hypothetical protein